MKEIKVCLDAKEAFLNYIKQFEKNISSTGSDFDVDMNDSIGSYLSDYVNTINVMEYNIKKKEESILFMKECILGCVDKISLYNEDIKKSKNIIEEAKENIIDLIEE